MKDLIKALVILLLYVGVAPALGSFLARNRIWERWVLAMMVFMPSLEPGKLTLMVVSVETYRGHTKGFEYSHLDVLGLALILAAKMRDGPRFHWLSPGASLYFAYCAASCLSIVNAYNVLYLVMAAWKFTKVAVVMIGVYHAFRDAEDLRWVMRSIAIALIVQGLAGLKMRFVDGIWQVKGWFEHQNPMAMWCYLCAGPALGWAFLQQTKPRDVWLCLAGVAFAALLILLSVSRAGLAAFAAGCAAATALAWLRGFKLKTFSITAAGGFAALLAGPALGWAFLQQTKPRDVWLCLAGVAFAALLILLSVSRAGLAAFAAGCAAATALAWLRGFKLKTFSITAAGGFAALLAGMLALDSLMARMDEVKSRDETEDLRDILNKQSRAMLMDHPLGIGWNNWGVANSLPIPQYAQIIMDWDEERGFRIIDENYYANPLTESLYWLLLSENGFQGFGLYVLFTLTTVLWMVRSSLKFWKSPTGMFTGCLLIVLGITYCHGLVERVLTQTKNLSFWMILCGILARIETCRRAGHDLPDPENPTSPTPRIPNP